MTAFDDLPLGTPARRALEDAGVTSLEAAATRTEAEISALRGVGPRAVGVLGGALAEHGLAFASTEPTTAAAPAAVSTASPYATAATPAAVPGIHSPYNALAIVAFVTAFLLPILGVVFGHLALPDLRRKGERGRELAIAGLVIGYVLSGLILLLLLAWVGTFIAILGSVLWLVPTAVALG